jgi:hypothetical protein
MDILRAFGIRDVDIDNYKMSQGYEARTELSHEVKNKLAILERGWVKAFLIEDEKKATDHLQGVYKKVVDMEGPMPSNEQILNRLIHYRTQKDIFKGLIQKTKDKELRKEMIDYLQYLKENRFVEGMTEDAMKAIRADLIKRLTEIFK